MEAGPARATTLEQQAHRQAALVALRATLVALRATLVALLEALAAQPAKREAAALRRRAI